MNADLGIYTTRYGSMNGWVADLIDQETAAKVAKVWGLGSDTPVYGLQASHHMQ